MHQVSQFGFDYDAFDADYEEQNALCEEIARRDFCNALDSAVADGVHTPTAEEQALLDAFHAENRRNLAALWARWDAEAQAEGYADHADRVRAQRRAQGRPLVSDRPARRNSYRTLTLRERVELNRREEERKHAAFVARHNSTAIAGLKKLHKAIEKSRQPKQLALFG